MLRRISILYSVRSHTFRKEVSRFHHIFVLPCSLQPYWSVSRHNAITILSICPFICMLRGWTVATVCRTAAILGLFESLFILVSGDLKFIAALPSFSTSSYTVEITCFSQQSCSHRCLQDKCENLKNRCIIEHTKSI
jgi:hypothetical protein